MSAWVLKATLMYRPLPKPYEGLNGYLLRLAEGNGYDGIGFLCARRISEENIKQWLGLRNADPLDGLTHQLSISSKKHIKPWNNHTSRYCPECLRNDPVWRLEWECNYVTACPFHGCQLIGVCHICGEELTWRRGKLLSCDCCTPLRQDGTKAAEAELMLAELILEKLYGKSRPHGLATHFEFMDMCGMIHMLGSYCHADGGTTVPRMPNVTSFAVAQGMVKAVAGVLVNWPFGLYQMLDNLRDIGKEEYSSLSLQYRFFYTYVHSQHQRRYKFLRRRTENHMVKSWVQPIGRGSHPAPIQARSEGTWVPLSVAIKNLGTTDQMLRWLFEAGQISADIRMMGSGQRSVFIGGDNLPAIKNMLDDMIGFNKACLILNVGEDGMMQLCLNEVTRAYVKPGQTGKDWEVSNKTIQEIIAVGNRLPKVAASMEGCCIRMDYILKFWMAHEFLFPALILAVLNREIVPVAICPELAGIQGWMFDLCKFRHWHADQIEAVKKMAMTAAQVAEKLKVDEDSILHFMSAGILRSFSLEGLRGKALVTRDEFQRFVDTYALSQELSRSSGLPSSDVNKILKKYRIKPISERQDGRYNQYLYQRIGVMEDLLRIPVQTVYAFHGKLDSKIEM